jgi:GNAT superfamily N-acetyltransferase
MQLTFDPPSSHEFAELYAETGWGDRSVAELGVALDGSWVVCCARDEDGALRGMGRLLGDGALHAFVTELIVATDARGNGLGTALLEALVAESRRRGVPDVQLFAARGRLDFYLRNGFAARPADAPGMELA